MRDPVVDRVLRRAAARRARRRSPPIIARAATTIGRRCGRRIGPICSRITPPPSPRAPAASGIAGERASSSCVRAELGHPPGLHERDAVGQRDRRRPVRDHERRPSSHHFGQRRADLVLLRRVDCRRGVVEDQHLRVGQDRAGDRDPLPLAAGEREAALSDHRLVALGQQLDELLGAGELGRPRDLVVAGVGRREPDVAAHGVPEEERVLEHDADTAPQIVQAQLAYVDVADRHPSAVRVVEAREQGGGGRLARTGGADERQRRACRDLEIEAVEHRRLVSVREPDVVEADRRAARERSGSRGLDDDRLGTQDVDHAPRGRDRPLRRAYTLADRPQRVHEQREVEAERRERPDRDVAVDRTMASVPEHDEHPDQRQRLERGQEDGVDVGDVECSRDDVVRAPLESRRQRRLRSEALHDPDAGDRLLDERGRVGEPLLVDLRPLGVAVRVPAEADAEERQRGEHGQAEPPVDRQEHGRGSDEREHVADRVPDRVEGSRDQLCVVRRARDQLAGSDPVVVMRVELEGAAEDRIAHLGVGARPVADREDVAKRARDGFDDPERDDAGARPPERATVAVDDPRVDRAS